MLSSIWGLTTEKVCVHACVGVCVCVCVQQRQGCPGFNLGLTTEKVCVRTHVRVYVCVCRGLRDAQFDPRASYREREREREAPPPETTQ